MKHGAKRSMGEGIDGIRTEEKRTNLVPTVSTEKYNVF